MSSERQKLGSTLDASLQFSLIAALTKIPGNSKGVGHDWVFVTFRFGGDSDEQGVREIAQTARVRFEGMPGLRSKAFTFNSAKGEAANFYVWDSDAAKAFFTDELLERVTGLYRVRPIVEFVQIAELVENTRT